MAKQTKINTFVIDIKDNESPGYKADAMKEYSPTNYRRAGDKEALYKKVVNRLHEEGFYVVGRITCFKDSYFVKDNPGCAITDRATGEPFKHNKAFWPSGFDRRVWEFNVALAKEAVEKFGFNEINFDYVRFPDRMTSIENLVDYHNRYGESKVQAIQRFVQYACDEIHKVGAYVSVDVFGESANPGYTTAYGQYWPAISNVADVISGMPYPGTTPTRFCTSGASVCRAVRRLPPHPQLCAPGYRPTMLCATSIGTVLPTMPRMSRRRLGASMLRASP